MPLDVVALTDDLGSHLRGWWQKRAAASESTTEQPTRAAELIRGMARDGLLDLPLPGAGATAARWSALTAIGALDLTVGRLAEAHTDAIAILAELGSPVTPDVAADDVWGVWAAEPPAARLAARRDGSRGWRLQGRKAWCSGAGICRRALVTAYAGDGPRLFAVDLGDPEVRPAGDRWPVVALSGTDTRSVEFADAPAVAVGEPGDYVGRAGFWHGAVGVAAVWYGGAVAIADSLLSASRHREFDAVDQVHLGAVDTALFAARSALQSAARAIDDDPRDLAGHGAIIARRSRAVVETAASVVIDRVGRALGPAPLALDAHHARLVTDLRLYLRQSHADRDLADLGRRLTEVDVAW